MPPRLFGLGNNIAGALDPRALAPPQLGLTDISETCGAPNILLHTWTCTIAYDGAALRAWGSDPAVGILDGKEVAAPVKVLVDNDRPTGILAERSVLLPVEGALVASEAQWDDVGITLDAVLGYRRGEGLFRFSTLEALGADDNGERITHSFLAHDTVVKILTSESRALLLAGTGSNTHVLEVVFDYRSPNSPVTAVEVIDDLEGLGVTSLRAGPGNRFSAVTEGGEGYILGSRGEVEVVSLPELVDAEDDGVEILALGYEFQMVSCRCELWARGRNDFGQCGDGPELITDWTRLPIDGKVSDVHPARFSVVVSACSN